MFTNIIYYAPSESLPRGMIFLRSTPKIIKSVSKITEGEEQSYKRENEKEVIPLRHHLFYGRDKIDMTAEASSIRSRDKA